MRMRIKDFTTKVGSGVTPKGGATAYQDHGIPLFRSQNITNEGLLTDDIAYISEDIHNSMSGSKLRPNDVLLNITGASIGRCYYLPEDFTEGNVNQHVCIIRLKKNVLPAFLYYNLISATGQRLIDRCQTGANREGLTKEDLCNFEFEIPSIERQKGIVKYLNEKNSLITNQVSLLTSKRDAYLRLKKSIINRAVTKGLNPDVQMKDSGVDWIGMIPEGWKMKRMKECVSLIKGRTPGEMTFDVIGFPYLTMDYLRNREGKDVMYPLNPEGLLKVEDNEILVLWDGANAGEFIFSKEGYLSSTMAVIKCKRNTLIKKYLYYLLKVIEADSKYYANGTTIPHFDSKTIFTREYPMPPLSEQQAIAAYLDGKCSKIDTIVANLDKQISKYADLKRSLIDEVITGKRAV